MKENEIQKAPYEAKDVALKVFPRAISLTAYELIESYAYVESEAYHMPASICTNPP